MGRKIVAPGIPTMIASAAYLRLRMRGRWAWMSLRRLLFVWCFRLLGALHPVDGSESGVIRDTWMSRACLTNVLATSHFYRLIAVARQTD